MDVMTDSLLKQQAMLQQRFASLQLQMGALGNDIWGSPHTCALLETNRKGSSQSCRLAHPCYHFRHRSAGCQQGSDSGGSTGSGNDGHRLQSLFGRRHRRHGVSRNRIRQSAHDVESKV